MSAASAFTWRRICSLVTFRHARGLALAALASLLWAAAPPPACATETIAFVGALSGPAASLGRDQRDGFLLAVDEQHGFLGGSTVSVVQFDDGGEAKRSRLVADRILAAGIRIATGFTTTETALALQSKLAGKPVVLLSSGAAPVALAAESCSPNFFSAAPVEDAVHENAGFIARMRGYQTVLIVSSAASRSLVKTAFQRKFAGTISGVDDAAEAMRHIRQMSPEAVYVALPAGEIRSFLQSYQKSGLFHRIPIIAPDEGFLLEQLGSDFSGLVVSARWSAAAESERSRNFVAAFERRYGRKPSVYALQGYDAALLLGEALRSLQAKSVSAGALRHVLAMQQVEGIEGPLRFAANRFPVTHWHAWEIFDDSSGSTYLAPMKPTLYEYRDPYSERCKLH
jgi:branched-chain amino acid transport system substrate-binding protein